MVWIWNFIFNNMSTMKFKSKKGVLSSTIILGLNTFLIGISIFSIVTNGIKKDSYLGFILVFAVVALLFWLYFGTNYELNKEKGLLYRSGPFNGNISVDRITEITKSKTLWTGFKPATSRKGLIIKYDKYNEIYVSPKTNELFIKQILKLNDKIKITD